MARQGQVVAELETGTPMTELKWCSWVHGQGTGEAPGEVGQGHQGPLVPSGHSNLEEFNGLCCCFDFDFKNTES